MKHVIVPAVAEMLRRSRRAPDFVIRDPVWIATVAADVGLEALTDLELAFLAVHQVELEHVEHRKDL